MPALQATIHPAQMSNVINMSRSKLEDQDLTFFLGLNMQTKSPFGRLSTFLDFITLALDGFVGHRSDITMFN